MPRATSRTALDVHFAFNKSSEYLAKDILEKLAICGRHYPVIGIENKIFPNGEKFRRFNITSGFELLGETVVYVTSLVTDEDILDLQWVGSALATAGVRHRIFVIPWLAYSAADRSWHPGDVVAGKINLQILSQVGRDEGAIFLFLDLHYPCLLHYFEGCVLRFNLPAMPAILDAIEGLMEEEGLPRTDYVMGSTNLRRASWVNEYAKALGIPVVFVREKARQVESMGTSTPDLVVGHVAGKVVIVFDDIMRSGKTMIGGGRFYREAGALRVHAFCTHFAMMDDAEIQSLIDTPHLATVTMTNSHPSTQKAIVTNCEKFRVLSVGDVIREPLLDVLSPEMGIMRNETL